MCHCANETMKYKNTLILFLFIAILVSISSCGEKKLADVIVGEWKVEKVEFPEMDIAESIIESFRDEMLSSIYTFNEDGKFELKSGLIPMGAIGKWRLKEETKELYIEYSAMEKEFKSTYEIELVDENKIIFRQKFGGDLGEMEATLVKK
jgi:hypothetical protein